MKLLKNPSSTFSSNTAINNLTESSSKAQEYSAPLSHREYTREVTPPLAQNIFVDLTANNIRVNPNGGQTFSHKEYFISREEQESVMFGRR